MATFRIPILGFNTIPDTSGNVFVEPYSVKATNDVWPYSIICFNDTATRIGIRGAFAVPKNYVGTPAVVIVWTSTATSGNVVWDFDYRSVGGDNTTSLDQATVQQAVTVTDAAPSAANNRLEVSISLTAGNFAVDNTVQFNFYRDGADGADTMAAAALLHGLSFQYTDV
jgi:putative transposon-encoded protein